jgi:hypothetical protein
MLKGEVRRTDKELYLSPKKPIPLPPKLVNSGKINLSQLLVCFYND